MTQNYHRKQTLRNERRKSLSISPEHCRIEINRSYFDDENEEEEDEDEEKRRIELNSKSRPSICFNSQRRLSTISQLCLPHGDAYHPQKHQPATGIENQTTLIHPIRFVDEINDDADRDRNRNRNRRLSVVSQLYQKIDETSSIVEENLSKTRFELKSREKKFLFIFEPILSGFLIFPLLVLYWECGWNLFLILLNILNGFSSHLHLDEITQEEFESYSFLSMFVPYFIVQSLFLLIYLFQNSIFHFIQQRNRYLRWFLIKIHIFLLGTFYIIQWEMLWTIFDQLTPHEWYFELTMSFTGLFSLIVLVGHLSDLICSPFIYSYDSIQFCIFIGCPLLTREMKQWKIHLINYILYEWIISSLSIITWRGFYHCLDEYLYPDNLDLSSAICLIIGYLLYFPLMYFQTYFEQLNSKYEFWTFISINFPQFYRNIRHLLAFVSCVFAWRGFWVLYDNYLYLFEDYYKTYLLIYILTFVFLCCCQTASSVNGPLTHIEDEHQFFPLYPHSYVSIVYKKIRQSNLFHRSKSEDNQEENTKL